MQRLSRSGKHSFFPKAEIMPPREGKRDSSSEGSCGSAPLMRVFLVESGECCAPPCTGEVLKGGESVGWRFLRGFFVFLLALGISSPRSVHAQTARIWTNNSATNNLSNAVGLWQGGVNPVNGDSWTFQNTSNAALTNNFSSGFGVAGMTFAAGAGSTTIGGNSILLSGGVINLSTALETLNIAINNAGNNSVNASNGSIRLGGAITGSGTLSFSGAGTTTLATNVSYAGMTVSNSGNLTAAGQFYLNGGAVFNNTGTFNSSVSGQFRMQGGTNTVNFNLGTATLSGFNEGGYALNGINTITVGDGATVSSTTTCSVGYTGGLTNVLVVRSGGLLNLKGMFVIQAGSSIYGAVTNYGTISNASGGIGLLAQSGTNNVARFVQAGGMFYNPSTMMISGGNGTLACSNSSALVNVTGGVFSNVGSLILANAGNSNTNTFRIDGGTAYVSNITYGSANTTTGSSNAVILNGGTLIVGGMITVLGSTTNTFTWNGGTLKAGGSSVTFLSDAPNLAVSVGAAGGTFDVNGFSNEIGANILGTGTLTVTSSAAGTGTLTLSGSNAFSGTTLIGGGILNLGTSGSLAASTNIVISGGTLMIGGSNQISTNATVTLSSGTITMAAPGSVERTTQLTVSSLGIGGPGILDYSSLFGATTVTVGSLNGLGATNAGGNGILNVWNWDRTSNASTRLVVGNAVSLSKTQRANINFYSGSGELFLGSATLSSGGTNSSRTLVPDTPSISIGGSNGLTSYSVSNAIGGLNIALLGNSSITYTASSSILSGSGTLSIAGTNNLLLLNGVYGNGSSNDLLSGSLLVMGPGAAIAVTGPAIGNATLTVGQSYTNAYAESVVTLRTNATSVYLTVLSLPEFHVSPLGDDSNPGTVSRPFATIQRAQQAVRDFRATPLGSQQEVDVVLHAGTYWQTNTISFTDADSGGTGAPVVYTSAPGEEVAISGGRRISGAWAQSPGKPYWQITIPDVQAGKWSFNSLTVNGQSAVCARYPNEGEKELRSYGPEPGGDPRQSLVYQVGDFDPSWTNLQDIDIVLMGFWTGTIHSVAVVDPVKRVLRFQSFAVRTVDAYERLPRYYLRNVFEKLDSPGEWYLNKKTGILYYYPRPGEDLSSAEVIAPVLKSPLVALSGNLAADLPVQYIQFKGIHFRHADTDLDRYNGQYRQGHMFLDGSISATAFRQGLFEGCTFEQLGDYALNLADGCRDVTVQGCHFWDLGAGAMLIGVTDLGTLQTRAGSASLEPGQAEPLRRVTNITVDNNIVHRVGTIWNGCYGIVNRFASGTRITHNEIFDTHWDAIGLDARWDNSTNATVYSGGNEVAYNYLHDLGLRTQTDAGAIYQFGPLDTHIHHNLIHDTFAYLYNTAFSGIYLDQTSCGALVEKNIVYNLDGLAFTQNFGSNNVIANNIGAFARDGIFSMANTSNNYVQLTQNIYVTTNNIAKSGSYPLGDTTPLVASNFYQTLQTNTPLLYNGVTLTNWQKLGWDIGSVEGNAGFADPLNYDFSLTQTSEAVTKIGFVPFGQEIASAGLYGDSSWRSFPSSQSMRPLYQYQTLQDLAFFNDFSIDPNLYSNGVELPVFGVSVDNSMIITNEVPGINGPKSIKVITGTNMIQMANPYASVPLYGLNQGRVQVQVSLLQPTNSLVSCRFECRSKSVNSSYSVGPTFTIATNGLLRAGTWTTQMLPRGQWNTFTVSFGLGAQGDGTYSLTVSNSTGVTNRTLPFSNPKFTDMGSFLIIANDANNNGSCYLDGISLKTAAINFPTLGEAAYSNGMTLGLGAVSTTLLPVTYSSADTNVVRISGTNLTVLGTGTATIVAMQSGDSTHLSSVPVTNTLVVNKGAATVSITGTNVTYDGIAKGVVVNTDPSNLDVAVVYNGLTNLPVNVGSYSVVATVSNANYTGSGTATLTIADPIPLPAAPSPTASPALQQVLLSWNAVHSATSYTLLRSSYSGGPYVPIATGLTNLSYTDTAVTEGNSYFYVLTASNATGTGPASSQVSAIPLSAIQAWRQQWFGTTDNGGSATDTANPTGDGIPNLMKYALGLDPLSTNAAARPQAILTNGYLQMTFSRTNDPLLTYSVEGTADFTSWTNIWSSTGASNVPGPVTVRDTNTPVSGTTRRFLRLRVTAP
jgi:hypothetical protein